VRNEPKERKHNAAIVCPARRRCDILAMLKTANPSDPITATAATQ